MNPTDVVLEDFIKVNICAITTIPIIAVYQKPADYPEQLVARLWDCNRPTKYIVLRNSLEEIRTAIPPMIRLNRCDFDDPVIVETWI